MTITDTPGLMWPKITHDSDGFMLAASHAIGRNAVIDSEVAIFLAALLLRNYPVLLAERYGLAIDGMDGVGVVEAVAKKRGCIVKGRRGGELDLEKAGMVLLTDYRSGKLGRISLESPASRAAMLADSETAAAPPAAE
jgi:ribosome biogenesis GTPase A